MDDATSIIGIAITSIVVLITISTGILYYLVIYRDRKQHQQVGSDTNISTATEIKVSTTSF
jgi:heme/copper-type cytochrome/quinol oxidase subunit 2